jgi:hypothetical protein
MTAPPNANGACQGAAANVDEKDRQLSTTATGGSLQPIIHRHHADAPLRRAKSIQELIDGAEYAELLDRARPGWQRGRR